MRPHDSEHGTAHCVLTAASGLGTYVPALKFRNHLRRQGLRTSLHLYEELLDSAGREKVLETAERFRQDFRFAKMAQRLSQGRLLQPALRPGAVEACFEAWRDEGIRSFVLYSGVWSSLVERYRQWSDEAVEVHCVHVDAVRAVTWQSAANASVTHDVFLFSLKDERVHYFLADKKREITPIARRERRLLAHGGGWGIGNFQVAAGQLRDAPFALDLCAPAGQEAVAGDDARLWQIVDGWVPWKKCRSDDYEFPPMIEVGHAPQQQAPATRRLDDIASRNMAIVSKPGGGTLLDSIEFATPVIFLDPFGEYERANAELWERLGFGISMERWQRQEYSLDVLVAMHERLLIARDGVANYAEHYVRLTCPQT